MTRIARLVGNHPDAVGIAGTLVALAVIVLPFLLILADRDIDLSNAREVSENLTSIMVVDLEKDGGFRDAQLEAMVRNAEDPSTWSLPEGIRNRLLFGSEPQETYVDRKFITDSTGRIIASPKYADEISAETTVSDRDYFLVHKNNPSVGLFFSHPFVRRPAGALALGYA